MWRTDILSIFALSLGAALAQSPRDIGQLFNVNGIVPDLLSEFEPTSLLQVMYNFTLTPGQISSQNGSILLRRPLTC
jgi:hypothetical protein